MAQCDFDPATLRCRECGYQATRLPTFRKCVPPPLPQWQPLMVGDIVERALTSIGITKSLVERLTRTEGKPGGCGCGKRKQWMNEQGVKAQVAIRRAAHQYAKTIGIG